MARDRVQRLEIAVFGLTGDNGLVGNSKAMAKDVAELREMLQMVRTIVATSRYVVVLLLSALAMVNVDTLVTIVHGIKAVAR